MNAAVIEVRPKKKYWVGVVLSIPLTLGLILPVAPFIWMIDKSMAKAAYMRQQQGLPPSWYDAWYMWEWKLKD